MCLERWSSSELLHKLQCGDYFFYVFTPPSTCNNLEKVKLALIKVFANDNTQYYSPCNYISPLSVVQRFENPIIFTSISRKSIIHPRKRVTVVFMSSSPFFSDLTLVYWYLWMLLQFLNDDYFFFSVFLFVFLLFGFVFFIPRDE